MKPLVRDKPHFHSINQFPLITPILRKKQRSTRWLRRLITTTILHHVRSEISTKEIAKIQLVALGCEGNLVLIRCRNVTWRLADFCQSHVDLVARDHDATTVVFLAVAVCNPDAEFGALGGG